MGTVRGVMAKFNPFLSSDVSLLCNLLLEILTTHFFFSSSSSVETGGFFSFRSCLRSISILTRSQRCSMAWYNAL